jgi:hypothetical protein
MKRRPRRPMLPYSPSLQTTPKPLSLSIVSYPVAQQYAASIPVNGLGRLRRHAVSKTWSTNTKKQVYGSTSQAMEPTCTKTI